LAYRLWQVDQQLNALQRERTGLLAQLRTGEGAPVTSAVWGSASASPPPGPAAAWPAAYPAAPRPETSPKQVQNTLLTLGAVLLGGDGVVFTAVTYQHLGVVGRALVLLVLTAVAAWAPTRLLPRGLAASAEAIAGVAVVLAVLDVFALRRAGLAEDVDASSYWAVGTAVLAAALGTYGAAVPVRVARWAAAVLAQLPLLLALDSADAGSATAAPLLAAQAAADGVVAAHLPLPRDTRVVVGGLGGFVALLSLSAAAGAVNDDDRAAWLGFAALAVVAAGASWQARGRELRDALAAPVVPLLALAAWAAARPELTHVQEPLVAAAVAVLCLQVVGLLPADRRLGAAAGALAVSAVTVAGEAEPIAQALIGPFSWLGDPWSRTAETARGALGDGLTWDGTVVTLVVLAAAALAVVTAGLVLDRLVPFLVPAGVLLVLSAMTLPLGFATSYGDALLLLLLVAGALCLAGVLLLSRLRLVALALVGSGVVTALLAAAWSTADEDSTLLVLPLVAVLCGALSLLVPGVLTALGLALGAGALAALGAHRGLAVDQVGGLLLAAVVVCAALAVVLRLEHRWGAEAALVATALAAVSCAAAGEDPGWTSWTLGGSGVAALAVATRRDRRVVGLLGGLLLSASSWVRLGDAGVDAPEPYVAPLVASGAVAAWFRRRSHPQAGSWELYGATLGIALVPSLVRSWGEDQTGRALLLLAVAVAVALVGGATRQQAPLAVGSVVAALDALRLLAPYADAVPQWLLLGGLGLLLVLAGATYEARLRDLRRLRASFDAMS
jgi:hypothetical protein